MTTQQQPRKALLLSLIPGLGQIYNKQKAKGAIFLGVMLILVAAFREIGIDPDSLNYAMLYQNPSNSNIADHIEYSHE